jgi:hypothetical protein
MLAHRGPAGPETRHNGPMACIHGLAPSECLICQTLGSGSDAGSTKTAVKSKGRRAATLDVSPPGLERSGGDAHPSRTHGRTFAEIGAILIAIILAAIAIGLATDVVRGLFHLFELAMVAVVAAAIGYGAGRAHGVLRRKD